MGDTNYIFLKEDGGLSSMNLDMFECGERIVLNKKIPNLKNIINIYTEVSSSNKYEPIFYDAYAQDIEGKKNNISKYIFE